MSAPLNVYAIKTLYTRGMSTRRESERERERERERDARIHTHTHTHTHIPDQAHVILPASFTQQSPPSYVDSIKSLCTELLRFVATCLGSIFTI